MRTFVKVGLDGVRFGDSAKLKGEMFLFIFNSLLLFYIKTLYKYQLISLFYQLVSHIFSTYFVL